MLYLSGGITGKDREDYMSEFSYYEQRLTQERTIYNDENQMLEQAKVINPAKVCDCLPPLHHTQYMRICGTLLGMCDTIYMLPNWENSKGAKEELAVALSMGMTVEVAPTE